MLSDEGVHRRNAGDVDDGDPGARLHDLLEEVLHHDLRAGAVQRADQRQRENAVPQLHHGGRQLQHVLLLAQDDLFAALLIDLGRVKPELVEQRAGGPHLVDERVRLADLRSESREERLLQREHEGGRLRRAEAHLGPPARDLVQHLANRLPLRARDVVETPALDGVTDAAEQRARLLAQVGLAEEVGTPRGRARLLLDPLVEEILLVLGNDLRESTRRSSHVMPPG